MIWQLSKGVSLDIQTLRSGLKKRGASEFFKPTSEYLDICDETLFLVFDVATFFFVFCSLVHSVDQTS